jgi:NitT/TauT family transport system permease protein
MTSPRNPRQEPLGIWILKFLPLILIIIAWYLLTVGSSRRSFFFGSPSSYFEEFVRGMASGQLLNHTLVTAAEALAGFVIGNLVGITLGLSLWHSPFLFRLMRAYIIALGSAPLFAFAPIIVVWFGTGFFSKVVVATLSTVFVALMQAYKGAEEVDTKHIEVIKSFGGDDWQIFRKVIVPASLVWVMAAFRLNIGLALLGAFLGEYISSERGLGHLILVAGGLYNIPLVLVGVSMIIVLGWALSWLVSSLERPVRRGIIHFL